MDSIFGNGFQNPACFTYECSRPFWDTFWEALWTLFQ